MPNNKLIGSELHGVHFLAASLTYGLSSVPEQYHRSNSLTPKG